MCVNNSNNAVDNIILRLVLRHLRTSLPEEKELVDKIFDMYK